MSHFERPRAVVVETTASPLARLKPVPIDAVHLSDSFWEPRRRLNHEVTIPSQYQHCVETGRLDNFRRAAGKIDVPFRGIFFNDSDIYKWLEAASSSLASYRDDESLDQLIDSVIAEVADAQDKNGYLDTYFTFERVPQRWTDSNLHEMYCAGHLIQAAVAHYRATGKTTLLTVAERLADHICDTFGPAEQGKRLGLDGHAEIEMALVELSRATGNDRYLQQSRFFVDIRGHKTEGHPYSRFGEKYNQEHVPFRELDVVIGHAVRMLYLATGVTDLYLETGDETLKQALDKQWANMTMRRMYVSGGLGARWEGESFGTDYQLPNERAYTETCAAIASVMWNWRLLSASGDARYADLLEHTLYNAVLPGLSLDGQQYFYQNPLADDGMHRRQPWFGCACCPPNVARLLAQLPGYFYSVSDKGVWVNLYAEGSAEITPSDGQSVRITQRTNYPWDGDILLEVAGQGKWSLFVRIPAWVETDATVTVNGEVYPEEIKPGTYLELSRDWSGSDTVHLHLPMPVRRVYAHPYIAEDRDTAALLRGPLLYCLEGTDHAGVDLRDIVLPHDSTFTAKYDADVLGGLVTLTGKALAVPVASEWTNVLYRPQPSHGESSAQEPITLTAIPYYAWANREAGRLQVWIREEK